MNIIIIIKIIFIKMAIRRLHNEFKQYLEDPSTYYSISPEKKNFLIWNIILLGPPETIFEGGIFRCKLEFTKDYPNKPPVFTFIDNLYHPNIYPNGQVCMSILHEGEDIYGYENISERWNPSQSVDSILMSLLLVLIEPNFESPANVDASKLWKTNFNEYKKIIYKHISSI
jgi:ubiquitin-protein ligase